MNTHGRMMRLVQVLALAAAVCLTMGGPGVTTAVAGERRDNRDRENIRREEFLRNARVFRDLGFLRDSRSERDRLIRRELDLDGLFFLGDEFIEERD